MYAVPRSSGGPPNWKCEVCGWELGTSSRRSIAHKDGVPEARPDSKQARIMDKIGAAAEAASHQTGGNTKMMRWFVLLGFIAVLPTMAQGNVSAGKLIDNCKHAEAGFEQGICYGYISGWADQFTSVATPLKGKLVHPLFKEAVTTGQLMRVFVKYVKDHPEKENHDANSVLTDACTEAQLFDLVTVE